MLLLRVGGVKGGSRAPQGIEIRQNWEGLSTNQHVGLGGWFHKG